jgi:hypothetical protein
MACAGKGPVVASSRHHPLYLYQSRGAGQGDLFRMHNGSSLSLLGLSVRCGKLLSVCYSWTFGPFRRAQHIELPRPAAPNATPEERSC